MSVAAPRMSIKSHLPWPLKLVVLVLVLGCAGAMAMWVYDLGRSFAGLSTGMSRAEEADLREKIVSLGSERDHYQSTANAAESRINMEKSAQAQLALQAKALETENAKLKEDLAFFEKLLPTSTGAQGVSIRSVQAELVAPNQLHYRILVMQGGKGTQDFNGNLQLTVTLLQGGKSAMMIFPDAKTAPVDADKYKLSFKHYQRMEGTLTLPEGAVTKAVQARILERGQVRAQQSTNL
ncbi:MAG: hypothetical protein JSS58_09515 [Proteobacteria bacterium]|nr:hypothetical protein [Pseudomonadota bacterium]